MKKIRLILLLIIFSSCGSMNIPTDGKCVYQRDEVDDFTGKIIKETKYYHISKKTNFNGSYLKVSGLKNDDEKYLQVSLLIQGQAFNLEEGKELLFLDDEKNISRLIIPQTKTSDYNGSDAFYVIERFPLSAKKYAEFKNNSFVKVRYETMDGYLDFDIPENSRDVISYVLGCLE